MNKISGLPPFCKSEIRYNILSGEIFTNQIQLIGTALRQNIFE